MTLKDGGTLIIVLIGSLGAIGLLTKLITKQPDTPIEEAAEERIEILLEEQFGLPEGTLEGAIDLSPLSPEKD